jgi:UDPglucose 6-dehydrogenase
MSSIAVIGTGYVGLVSGACLADFGNTVICVDNNKQKIQDLEKGIIPIFEPGLDVVVEKNVKAGRLSFSTSLKDAVAKSQVVFIAVGTPPADDGSADLQYVEQVAREIGQAMAHYTVIVDKSTVPVGTARKVHNWVTQELEKRQQPTQQSAQQHSSTSASQSTQQLPGASSAQATIQSTEQQTVQQTPVQQTPQQSTQQSLGPSTPQSTQPLTFDVVSNPEFLREGSAVQDFMHPDRVVIGAESEKARTAMKDVYRALYLNETPYIETGLETAEMIKYASNAFLAVKITFINEVANLCEKVGANVQDVARAMGRDGRIGGKFLHPGPGYGGSCFPKDTQALARIGKDFGESLSIVEATIQANERQKDRMVQKITQAMEARGGVKGKTFAVLGLAFKPNTDDMREAPAITIIEGLAKAGGRIKTYDPEAMKEASWRLEHVQQTGALEYTADEYQAIHQADALIIVTEWNQFRNLDLEKVKASLTHPILFDLRNIYKRADLESKGFEYHGVGQ